MSNAQNINTHTHHHITPQPSTPIKHAGSDWDEEGDRLEDEEVEFVLKVPVDV